MAIVKDSIGKHKITESDIDEALALVGLTHLQNQSALKLSAGERQRLSLARAKCQRPKMILLDEPTSHLDIGHQVALLNTLVQQSNACEQTMIASMHDIGLIQRGFTHALLLMNDGSYLAGSLSEVINPPIIPVRFAVTLLYPEKTTH